MRTYGIAALLPSRLDTPHDILIDRFKVQVTLMAQQKLARWGCSFNGEIIVAKVVDAGIYAHLNERSEIRDGERDGLVQMLRGAANAVEHLDLLYVVAPEKVHHMLYFLA